MAKLKLGPIADDKPVRLTAELPAAVHRNLLAYADALGRETGKAVEPAQLVAPMLARFMAADRAFAKTQRRAESSFEVHVVAPAMAVSPGLARVRCIIDRWLGWSARAGLSGGCPIAAALFELDDAVGPIRDHVVVLEKHWRALLSTLVDEAIAQGELHADLDQNQFVWELCGIYLSHHVSNRFLPDPIADQRAQQAVNALIERAGDTSVERKTVSC